MRKLTSTFAATAHDPRTRARVILAFVASVLVVLLALMGMGSGPGGTMAFAQDPTPTEPPSTDPEIQLINPSETPDVTARPDDTNPSVSDRNDGVDETYHIVAWSRNEPSNALVEAYFTPITALGVELPEITIGLMTRLPESPDTWEFHWAIPEPPEIPEGNGRITVRMFGGGALDQAAEDSVDVRMRHSGSQTSGDAQAADVTVEYTWPTNGGPLGFYKPRGGSWRTLLDASRSSGNSLTYFFYSVSDVGTQPEWKQCATATGSGNTRVQCTLADGDLPSHVSAVYAIASEATGLAATRIIESGDAHRVEPYVQDPHQMKIDIRPTETSDTGGSFRAEANTTCIAFLTRVTDQFDRPVQGANVDLHATGPTDQLRFGEEITDTTVGETTTTDHKPPDRGDHSTEPGANCDRPPIEDPQDLPQAQPTKGQQGDHNRIGQPDIKHRESAAPGTGLSQGTSSFGPGSAGFGELLFELFSPATGLTDVTAWVDDAQISEETQTRAADSDTLDDGEPTANVTLQWLPDEITVRFDPPGDTAQVGTCNKYVVEVRAGSATVPGINVDVHATGPNNELDFCDPGDGTPRRAPQNTGDEEDHEAEDDGEAHHRGDPPQTQHTEGETDDSGNFVIGITSPISGDTALEAWVDGERGDDNDTLDSGEPSGRATKSWAASLADAQVSFVNPSAYGGSGTKVSNKPDANQSFHIVTRVDSFETPGVEILISEDDGATFSKIGDASQVGGTDTWDMFWGVNVPEGNYVLRARIEGTDRVEDQDITVNNEDETDGDPTDVAFETLELTRPPIGESVAFTNRETMVEGVASAGAEGVDLFYTKVAAKDTPQSADWISCGFAQPAADNSFQGACRLQGADQAHSVTGIAAITYDCLDEGCDPAPGTVREPGMRDSGDAHRVFGFEGRPRVTIEPAESGARQDACQRLVLSVDDETGQPIGDQNVDVHLTGPNDNSHFCTPGTGGTARRAPDQGEHLPGQSDEGVHAGSPDTKHTEGETNSSGRFVFGVTSPARGDSQIEGWVDQNDDDLRVDEPVANALVHWGRTSGSSRECTIEGTSGPDRLIGTPGDDVICGRGGKDEIRGRGGDDIIFGDAGHDDIRGNKGDDRILGGRGRDIIRGSYGRDTIRGGAQDDIITGFEGNDRLVGGGGDDTIRAGRGRDVLKGGTGNDILNGGRGIDRCRGGRGRDRNISCER